jgi:cytochrome P450
VSVSHPEGIRKILAQPLQKSAWYEVLTFPDSRFQNPLSATDPAIKMELSRHLAPAYTLSNVLRSEKSIDQVCELLFEWLDKYSASGEAIDLGEYFIYATSDIIGEMLFSKQFGFLREGRDIDNAIAYSHPAAVYMSIAGYFRWFHVLFLSNPLMTWLGAAPWGHLKETALAAIEERHSNPDARFDALAQWFRMLKENPDRMDEHEIQSGAFNAIAAGSEPTASTLQAFVYYMIRLPGAWERARAEVDAAGIGGMPTYADTLKLHYLQTCIKEAMRVFNPASMGLPRVVPKGGMTIGNRTFPAGTDVSVSIWVMHHSKEIWGPDAREFNPERWFGDDAHALNKYFIPVSSMLYATLSCKTQLRPFCSLDWAMRRVRVTTSPRLRCPRSVRPSCETTTSAKLIRHGSGNGWPTSPSSRRLGLAMSSDGRRSSLEHNRFWGTGHTRYQATTKASPGRDSMLTVPGLVRLLSNCTSVTTTIRAASDTAGLAVMIS